MNLHVKGHIIRSGKVSYDTRNRQYFGDLIKENGRSSRIYNEASYIDLTPNQPPRYRFHVKDYLGSNRSVVDENGYLLQSYPSGLAYGESGELTEDDRLLHNGKELISFNGLYMYDNKARQRDLIFNRFTSIDPMAEKYTSWSPYAVCGNNPINRIDPDGREWITDKDKNIIWNDNAVSAKTTPEGYTYVGNDKALLGHLGMSYNFSKLSSNQIGFVAFDENVGMHMINVKEKSNARIEVNAGMNSDNATETNVAGKTFDGVNVVVTNVSSNSGTDGELPGSSSLMKVEYGGKTYTTALTEPTGTNYYQTGTSVTQGVVSIPASNINTGSSFSKIEVNGNWWVTKPEGRTPVVTHGLLPITKSFTHTWTFPKR